VLGTEVGNREERRIRTSLTLSSLPQGQTLATFDFAFQPGIERSQIAWLIGRPLGRRLRPARRWHLTSAARCSKI